MNLLTPESGVSGELSSTDTEGDVSLSALPDFSLTSSTVSFEPHFYPEREKETGGRKLSRKPGLCDGEEVNDLNGKNPDFHVRGYIFSPEKRMFRKMVTSGDEFKMVSMLYSGHVYIKDYTLEGPIGLDTMPGFGRQWVYEYTLDIVASGEHSRDHGILNGPSKTPADHNGPAWGL